MSNPRNRWRVVHHYCLQKSMTYYGNLYRKINREITNKALTARIVNCIIRHDFPALDVELKQECIAEDYIDEQSCTKGNNKVTVHFN